MRVPLLLASPGMDDTEASRQKTRTPSCFLDDACGQTPAVVVYQLPELTGNGKNDVLSFAVGHQAKQVLYPDFTRFHAAVWTGTAFTAKTNFFV